VLSGEQHYFRLLSRYPGRIVEVIYDDLVKSPVAGFRQIYDFLNLTAPPDVTSFNKSTKAATAEQWTEKLSWRNVKDVDAACQELYDVVSNRWPH